MSISSMSGLLTAAYLNQLSPESNVCFCGKSSKSRDTGRTNESFSQVLENQRARQVNQDNYNRLKEAAGGKIMTTQNYGEKQSYTRQNTLLQYQRFLQNQAMLNVYGMNMYSGFGSLYGLSGLGGILI